VGEADASAAAPVAPAAARQAAAPGRWQLRLVFAGLMLAVLLAALDQTIIATALPTIVGELHGLEHMSWAVTAYLLAATIGLTIYGKLGDLDAGQRRERPVRARPGDSLVAAAAGPAGHARGRLPGWWSGWLPRQGRERSPACWPGPAGGDLAPQPRAPVLCGGALVGGRARPGRAGGDRGGPAGRRRPLGGGR
jgi:hypothetical protein